MIFKVHTITPTDRQVYFYITPTSTQKNFKKEKNSRFNVNMQLKLIYLQYEEAVNRRGSLRVTFGLLS